MRILIQRVKEASVTIAGSEFSRIGAGMLILLGIETADSDEDIEWLVQKAVKLRIFDDLAGLMNLDVREVCGSMLIVSQFTLHASTCKGNRPSYIKAARPEIAMPLYERFVERMREQMAGRVATGRFGAMMEVGLVNDGPVTIWIDSKSRE